MKPGLIQKLIAILILISASFVAKAQDSTVQMADTLRSNGKIFVVVGVLAIIFTGIVVFLIIILKNN